MRKILAILLAAVFLLAGCAKADETPAAENPADIVSAAIEAFNSGDTERLLALLADDFTFVQDPPGMKIEGKADYEASLQGLDEWNQEYIITSPYEVDGDKVAFSAERRSDDLRILGMDCMNIGLLFHIRNGKIASIVVTPDGEDWNQVVELSRGGIGIRIAANDEGILVAEVVENSPAFKAGIRAGDLIISVDGLGYAQMREDEPLLRIRGRVGSQVRLTVKRGDPPETEDFVVTRADMNQLHSPDSQPASGPESESALPAPVAPDEPEDLEQAPEPEEFDIVEDGLGIKYLADGYKVELIRPTAFGLPSQLSLLPDGDIVITDNNIPRLQVLFLAEGKIRTIVQDTNIMHRPAVAMPDGRICYGTKDGELFTVHPDTGVKEFLGRLEPPHVPRSMAASARNNIYVVTTQGYLYRFSPDGEVTLISDDLPFADVDYRITDIAAAADGTCYLAGWHRFVSISPEGEAKVITDDLHSEPTFCDIDPEGNVYIKDLFYGVRRFNPVTGALTPLGTDAVAGKDIMAISSKEFIFVDGGVDVFCRYSMETGKYTPLFVNTINSWAFAADGDDNVFLSTPYLEGALDPYMVRLNRNGSWEDLPGLTYGYISAADVDEHNRLCILADNSLYRVEPDGGITSIPLRSDGDAIEGDVNIAAGPGDVWYGITTNHDDSVKVWRADAAGNVELLPIVFGKDSFGGVFRVDSARIDVSRDGQLLIFVNAPVTNGRGPLVQRVFRADADGTNMIEVGVLDSGRICGMVDIAAGPDGDIFVKSPHDDYDGIHHIDRENNLSEFLTFNMGRDLKSIDVDPDGNVWFCSTLGIFRVSREP